ncbi:MAG: hypothetical protein SGARI_004185, partial [Bacillariaceae sp.]
MASNDPFSDILRQVRRENRGTTGSAFLSAVLGKLVILVTSPGFVDKVPSATDRMYLFHRISECVVRQRGRCEDELLQYEPLFRVTKLGVEKILSNDRNTLKALEPLVKRGYGKEEIMILDLAKEVVDNGSVSEKLSMDLAKNNGTISNQMEILSDVKDRAYDGMEWLFTYITAMVDSKTSMVQLDTDVGDVGDILRPLAGLVSSQSGASEKELRNLQVQLQVFYDRHIAHTHFFHGNLQPIKEQVDDPEIYQSVRRLAAVFEADDNATPQEEAFPIWLRLKGMAPITDRHRVTTEVADAISVTGGFLSRSYILSDLVTVMTMEDVEPAKLARLKDMNSEEGAVDGSF